MALANKPLLEQAVIASRRAFYIVGFFSLFVNLFMLTTPIYMLQLFDRVLASQSYDTLIFLTIIAVTALLVLALVDIARSRVMIKVSQWLDNYLSPTALAQSADEILRGSSYHQQSLRDIATVRQFLSGAGIFALFDAPWVPMYLIVIFLMHPLLGILSTVGAIVLFALALLNEIKTREPLAAANFQAIQTQQQIDATMRNAEVIQAMGMMPSIVKNWFQDNEKVLSLQALASRRSGVILSISKFMRLTLQLAILGAGAVLVINNVITPGAMIAASILMARALSPVEQAISTWKSLVAARQAYYRLQSYFSHYSPRTAGIKLPKPRGILTLENVYFVPKTSSRPIINQVALRINPGEVVALIGPSAAGKSTLARMMVGALKASAGSVRLDGADVYSWDRVDFGRYVGYLPQDVELFTGTVRENIARLSDDIDDEAVIKAAQLAGMHELILHFPDGYNTFISGGGYVLSGGQRQRIALARALYKQPQLVILDEPNSNLDHEGDHALARAVDYMKQQGCSVVVISHRPSIVQVADRVVVLNDGQIQMAGPRDEILAKLNQLAAEQNKAAKKLSQRPSDGDEGGLHAAGH
ncbi:MAG: type I secretion system permease/ATPase [Legionellales bacterium]|nr:type I secretion system permease/ATPase [Legionellales bacterium]